MARTIYGLRHICFWGRALIPAGWDLHETTGVQAHFAETFR
jgi:hypothetical protein